MLSLKCFYIHFRASTLARVNIYKIQKTTTFTHFTPKIFHISLSKVVQIYTFATVTVHICTATVARVYHILLISRFAPFFLSLLCAKQTVFSPQSSSSFSSYTYKHKNKHTHTQTQTHRQIITEVASSWSHVQDKLFELSCQVTRMSLTRWVRALNIRRVLWILGPSLKRHKGGEVSRRLKKSTGIRFSLFFFFFFN